MSAQTTATPEATPELDSPDSVHRGLRSMKTSTLRAAEEFRTAAEQKARDWARAADATADDLREKAEMALKSTQIRLKSLHEESETYVRDHPLKAILMALGAGFLAGVLIRR